MENTVHLVLAISLLANVCAAIALSKSCTYWYRTQNYIGRLEQIISRFRYVHHEVKLLYDEAIHDDDLRTSEQDS